jgi:SWI/SNF-related matrix-associated actin-dependent regulator 1 of chromatin subfamily A
MYRRDPILSSSPPPIATRASSHSDDERDPYVTQPTQILGERSPFFATPSDTTQPTLIVTPRAHPVQPVASSSQLQVPRSSPAPQPYSSPVMSPSQSQRPYGGYSNPMAPPGTGFFPPQAVRKPVVDLTSDDPPVERDPDEDESEYRSNIPLSKIEMSMTSRIEETPQKPAWDLSSYKYGNDQSRKRSAEQYGSSTPPKRQKPTQPQGRPSRAIPIDLTEDKEMTMQDIHDLSIYTKVKRLQAIYPNRSIKQLHDALMKKKGDFNDASEYLAEQESEDELLRSSPRPGVARTASNPVVKKTAQRGLKQPVQSLQNKYSKLGATQNSPVTIDSPEKEPPKQKRRLKSGKDRKKAVFSPSPEPPPARPQHKTKKEAPIVVSSDEDEGIAADLVVDDDSDAGGSVAENNFDESALLNFFNTCTVEAMVDLSGHKEEDIKEIFKQRPFASLDAVRKVHVDLAPVEKGKKKARKPRITTGQRLVESTEGMWNAYSTIDSVVKQCEALGKPMVAGMAKWGIDIFGASTEDGVDLTNIDDGSDTNSARDSGYHTPRSTNGSDTESKSIRKAATRTKLLKQPSNMNDDIELKDYQVVGLNWLDLLWKTKTSGILADDMGLGKTCQIIAFLSHLKQEGVGKPALIVVPGSTLENWCREFERFSKTINFTPYYGSQAERFSHQDSILQNIRQGTCDVIITTYDLTFRKDDHIFLRKCRPEICIFDEGHMLKNANTIRYKSLMKIPTTCRILLTGTPLQNSLQELMSILGFLMPQVFYGDQQEEVQEMLQILFKHKAKTMESDSHSSLLSAQRIQRARTMLTPFILRRKKAQVLKHLPKKTSRVEYCDLTDTQRTLYNQQLTKQRKILEDRAAGIPVKDHANVMMKLRQAAIHPLLFRYRYNDEIIRKMSKACIKEDMFAQSSPDIIFEELQLYQDYQCHQLASKYRALKKYELKEQEWMDSGKVAALLALLKKYKENGDRALVFSQFTSVMDILGWVFDDHDINFMRMDGSTPIQERQSLMDVFYQDESIQLFMISTKSGGAGINLACANKVIIFDSSFNPQDDIQAENRAHRVGQTREVEVVRLVTKGTVEEQIYALGVSKLELDKMVQGEDTEEGTKGKGKGKKKDDAAVAGGAVELSKAEEVGIAAVEKMMMAQLNAPAEAAEKKDEDSVNGDGEGGDVKEQFLHGLKKAGLHVAA